VVAIGALLAGGALTVLSLAQAPAPKRTVPASADRGPSFVIRARLVYPLTAEQPGPIERGTIIVRNGRIESVGGDLKWPPDLPLVDLRDEVICPGFVSAGSALTAQHAGPHSVSGAYHAIDAFDTYGDYTTTLARGTTTAHVNPGAHRLVSGVGGVVKLAGPPDQRTLAAAADMTMTLGVFDPPVVVDIPFYASSDVPIEPAERQRPDSRLGQYLELDEQIAAATRWLSNPEAYRAEKFDLHARGFAEAWAAKLPIRVEVRRAADIEGALQFAGRHGRFAYLVGLTEGERLADALCEARVPVVIRVEQHYRHPTANIGSNPEALEPRISTAGKIVDAGPEPRIALAGGQRDVNEDLRMAAILAVRGGMPPEQALAAITRVPAEILGVDDRVGSLAPGTDADLLVLTGEPLDINSYVRQVYVGGEAVFDAPHPEALVVRAGRVWVGDGTVLSDGSVLIENGKIQAVGRRVPHPPFARILDAGADSFLTPGFIDAHGHLGLEGDRTIAKPDLQTHRAIAVAGREFARVARAGVTTVMLAPYRGAPNGARMAAIKTYGTSRSELVASELSGLRFSLRGKDPFTAGIEPLRKALEAGKKYYDSWKKYEEELAKWKEGRDKGEVEKKKEEETETVVEDGKSDPITGTWEFTISGGPMPEPVTGTMTLKLTGNSIEGRIADPDSGEEAELTGTLNGDQVRLEIEAEDSPVGNPVIEATLDAEDHMTGKVVISSFEVEFEATRTDKQAVEFKVKRKRKRLKDGRPVPPKVNESLEPFRPLLDSKIPAVVQVETAAQIDAALKLFVEEYKVPLVLVGAEDATDVAGRIAEHKDKLGVVVPPNIVRTRQRRPYTQVADLSRQGIPVALQSDSEDGARSLPLMGLFAVRNGLGGDAALRALTVDAARMYKLDDRVGSLEPGKDADLLIFTGHPFDAGSRLERVIVAGHEVPDEP
jgi:imidazolonepropionase-like amidohydrolase